jgi:hypothetical protein
VISGERGRRASRADALEQLGVRHVSRTPRRALVRDEVIDREHRDPQPVELEVLAPRERILRVDAVRAADDVDTNRRRATPPRYRPRRSAARCSALLTPST